jgi:adenine-specific DNA-methyltransferase
LLAKGSPARPYAPLPDVQPWHYSGNRHHPTEKAEAILRPLVATFSAPGELVLDPFTGSGSTGLACAALDRRFVGIELDETHLQTAQQRLAGAYRKTAIAHLRPVNDP